MGWCLFPNFLNDSQEYCQAEAVWRKHWNDLIQRVGQESLWESPWLNTNFANGMPCRDGNPIFSAVSPNRRLGVHVVQLPPSDNPHELYVWTDTFAKGSPEAIEELVISCVLTDRTLLDALDLMKHWIIEEKVDLPQEANAQLPSPVTPETPPAPSLSEPQL